MNQYILHYCQGLIKALKENEKLITGYFHSVHLGDEDLKDHGLQPGDFAYWKRHQMKHSLQLLWKGPWQALLTNPCAVRLEGVRS